MSILSLNVRDVGGANKTRALTQLFKATSPDVVLLQETMCDDLSAIKSLSSILSGWEFCAFSSTGHSGGLLSCWNPAASSFKPFRIFGESYWRANFWVLSSLFLF